MPARITGTKKPDACAEPETFILTWENYFSSLVFCLRAQQIDIKISGERDLWDPVKRISGSQARKEVIRCLMVQ